MFEDKDIQPNISVLSNFGHKTVRREEMGMIAMRSSSDASCLLVLFEQTTPV